MKINIYYGGRGIIDDPTLFVLGKLQEVFLRTQHICVMHIPQALGKQLQGDFVNGKDDRVPLLPDFPGIGALSAADRPAGHDDFCHGLSSVLPHIGA